MTDTPDKSTDAVKKALTEGDSQRALLLAFRAGDEDLDHAWTNVQGIRADLDGQDLPKKAKDDACYRIVKHYLNGNAVPRWRQALLSSLIVLLLFASAAFILVVHTGKFISSVRSLSWPTTEATVLMSVNYTKKWTVDGAEQDAIFMNFYFSYQVEGKEYKVIKKKVPYYAEMGHKPFKRDDHFTIAYDPNNPEVVVYDRQLYDRYFVIPIGLVLLAIAIYLVAVEWSREKNYRRLLRIDKELDNVAT